VTSAQVQRHFGTLGLREAGTDRDSTLLGSPLSACLPGPLSACPGISRRPAIGQHNWLMASAWATVAATRTAARRSRLSRARCGDSRTPRAPVARATPSRPDHRWGRCPPIVWNEDKLPLVAQRATVFGLTFTGSRARRSITAWARSMATRLERRIELVATARALYVYRKGSQHLDLLPTTDRTGSHRALPQGAGATSLDS
jgi:hypothetical protein